MSSKSRPQWLSPDMASYVSARAPQPDPVLSALIERTREETGGAATMQVSAYQGSVLTVLTRAAGARRALEIGTFTGYSSTCIARGLADGGSLICCDVSEDYTAIARDAWAAAGVADLIDLRIAPAVDTIATLPADDLFDLVFIDADKAGYQSYVDGVAPLMRPGALLLVDNTLWSGRVLEPAGDDETTAVIQEFNDRLAVDDRFESVILPISDGMTMAVRR
jgi:caffeoyl-CoA O-methyltransferase